MDFPTPKYDRLLAERELIINQWLSDIDDLINEVDLCMKEISQLDTNRAYPKQFKPIIKALTLKCVQNIYRDPNKRL